MYLNSNGGFSKVVLERFRRHKLTTLTKQFIFGVLVGLVNFTMWLDQDSPQFIYTTNDLRYTCNNRASFEIGGSRRPPPQTASPKTIFAVIVLSPDR